MSVSSTPSIERTASVTQLTMRLTAAHSLLALLLAASVTHAATEAATDRPISDLSYARPDRLVDVGNGRMMNIRCRGAGSPTVVLDAGLGDDSISWALVQPAIATTTGVCSYDRAGLGFSDGSDVPSTASNNARDLHFLLEAAGIGPPYVLAAHSAAGMYIRVFADRYPSEVVGMVSIEKLARGPVLQRLGDRRSRPEREVGCLPEGVW